MARSPTSQAGSLRSPHRRSLLARLVPAGYGSPESRRDRPEATREALQTIAWTKQVAAP